VEGDPLATAATFLGTTPADLRTKLQGGQTLAQVATAAGKTPDALIQALVADAKAKIEQAKAAGTITADRATQLEAGLTDRLTKLVNSADPGRGPRR
jgi:6-phosphogluconolactonase/glucosamine-6-phosphate isomerase/deaminase